MLNLIIQEEVFGAGTTTKLPIIIPSERITLASLIQTKAATKVRQINDATKKPELSINHRFLSAKEQLLNQPSIKSISDKEKKRIDDLQGVLPTADQERTHQSGGTLTEAEYADALAKGLS